MLLRDAATYGIIHVDIVIAMDIDNHIYSKGSIHQVQNAFGHPLNDPHMGSCNGD